MCLNSRHVLAGGTLFTAFVLEAWEMLALVYVGADVRRSLGIDAAGLGTLVSALFLGMIPGSLLAGTVADRIGRRRTCTWSLALYGVCTLLAAFAPAYGWLLAMRLLAGFTLSGLHVMAFPYFEELLPVRVRGKATVYLSSGWALGLLLAVGSTALLGRYGWRTVMLANALVALWALAIRALVPESPYWLAAAGRQERARAVLRQLGARLPDQVTLTVPEQKAGSMAAIFGGTLRRITLRQVVLNFVFSWGYWGLQTGLPELLADRGMSLPDTLAFTAVSAVCMIPGYLSASWLTHRRPAPGVRRLPLGGGGRRGGVRDRVGDGLALRRQPVAGVLQPGRVRGVEHLAGRAVSDGGARGRLRLGHLRSAGGQHGGAPGDRRAGHRSCRLRRHSGVHRRVPGGHGPARGATAGD
jgi:MFS transporter, putative metabolite:H+ symporter